MVCALVFGWGFIVLGIIALLFMVAGFFRFIYAMILGTMAWAVWNYLIATWAGAKPITWWASVGVIFLLLMLRGILKGDTKVIVRTGSPPTEGAERIVRR